MAVGVYGSDGPGGGSGGPGGGSTASSPTASSTTAFSSTASYAFQAPLTPWGRLPHTETPKSSDLGVKEARDHLPINKLELPDPTFGVPELKKKQVTGQKQ